LPIERDLLHLKQQLAAVNTGLPISFATSEAAPAASTEADEVKRIQALIKESPDLINAPDRIGETLLQSAAGKGKLAVVKLLLDSGAAVDGLQQPGLTALHYAAGNGHKAIVDLLLSKGAKPDTQTVIGVTALHLAARKGYESVAKALLAAGASVNSKTTASEIHEAVGWALHYRLSGSGQTPLLLAADAGYAGLVELLLAKGADANVVDDSGRTPLSYAVDKHYQPVVQLLLAAHANPNAGSSNLPLTEAAYYGDMPTLKLLLANGAASDINTNVTKDFRGTYGQPYDWMGKLTPLAVAVNQKHADAVAELIHAKADPDGSGPDGTRLIFYALPDAPTLKALLEGGADPNRPNRPDLGGMPPLIYAVTGGFQPVVELLLAYKADPNVGGTQSRWNPLQEAAERGRKGIAEVLLKAGADVNAKAKDGWTPLHIAVSGKQREVAELLLANHADPNAKNDEGQTPLHLAVQSGQRELAELLLANKADPNERNNVGQTPLDLAKSQAQSAQVLPPGATRLPPGMASPLPMRLPGSQPLNVTLQTPGAPAAGSQQESKPETMVDLLRQHGAVDDLPSLDRIMVRRRSTGYSSTAFTKGAHDWGQFTLLDLIGVQYAFLAASPDEAGGNSTFESRRFASSHTRFPFPDLAHLRIRRPASDLKSWQEQVVDLRPVLESGDCSKDVRLEWGDVVEIPEADHPLSEQWPGFSKTELTNLKKCLTRQVEIVINGQATNITRAPRISYLVQETQEVGLPGGQPRSMLLPVREPEIVADTPFWLKPVLLQSKLVLTSSDLRHVKVTRHDPASGQEREWVVDCSEASPAPDLWLRDGDKIEVPER
jgi:cytohesin